MNFLKVFSFVFLPALIVISAYATETGEGAIGHQVITRKSTLVENKAPAERFTGKAAFTRFPVMASEGSVAPAMVRFEAGAYTNWHIHPHGQYLIVVEGEGRTQEWGKPIQVIRTGDVIWCPPGVKHWHGGGEHTAMAHVAISPVANDDQRVTWLERVDLPKPASPSAGKEKETAKPISLSKRQLAIIPIAAFIATGDLERLKPALERGLEKGLTISDINELLSHQYAYVGFPRSLNGLINFKALLDERQEAGIEDTPGVEARPVPENTDYYQLGTDTLMYLTKASANRTLFEFAPAMDYALKAHLFGYLFSRDNISYIDRELTTIATLSALGNVNSQLQSHYKVAANLGLSLQHLKQVIEVMNTEVSSDMAENATLQLNKLYEQD